MLANGAVWLGAYGSLFEAGTVPDIFQRMPCLNPALFVHDTCKTSGRMQSCMFAVLACRCHAEFKSISAQSTLMCIGLSTEYASKVREYERKGKLPPRAIAVPPGGVAAVQRCPHALRTVLSGWQVLALTAMRRHAVAAGLDSAGGLGCSEGSAAMELPAHVCLSGPSA